MVLLSAEIFKCQTSLAKGESKWLSWDSGSCEGQVFSFTELTVQVCSQNWKAGASRRYEEAATRGPSSPSFFLTAFNKSCTNREHSFDNEASKLLACPGIPHISSQTWINKYISSLKWNRKAFSITNSSPHCNSGPQSSFLFLASPSKQCSMMTGQWQYTQRIFSREEMLKRESNNNSKAGNHLAFTLRTGWERRRWWRFHRSTVPQTDKQTHFPLNYFNSFLTTLPLSEKLLNFNRRKA